ncbi:xanthine dehydrogenase family protein subunit M [Dactylosporangium fulvum]|uniref:Xanthine dehydrogenase family protein subunit M n=1 Tax=Dactylosporangium fulvum TaxID=53359 RepID=A0ABY5VUW7_9ACTN|nr:xanthine dehydrogenase family protein subunit M [Dactylosporangium fulvum]UWP80854.1 xanthine dehydrogenase family protein subunit M [Dactylosporangium fulvum]
MKPFAYERVGEPAAALATMVRPGTVYLAGGTNLVDLMKLGVACPDLVVDVNDLPYRDIEALPDGGMRIGALVSNSDLAADRDLRTRFPAVSLALLSGASGQLRNRATVGGNLLQRTRCRYFQDVTKACNKRDPGAGCAAREGDHRDLAILGSSPQCIATNPSDLAVALSIMDASIETYGPHGPDSFSIHDFYRRPGERPERDTNLPHGSLVTGVVLPPLPMAATSTYRKVRDRASFAFATASVAAALDVRDGIVHDVRLAYGAVAHLPWRAWAAERAMRGAPATVDTFERAADEELAGARPLRDNAFKVPLVRNLTVAVLRKMTEANW